MINKQFGRGIHQILRARNILTTAAFLLLITLIAAPSMAASALSGTVWIDADGDNIYDTSAYPFEQPLSGALIQITDGTGAVVNTTSNTDGSWSANYTGSETQLRVEFSLTADQARYLSEGPVGGTSVRFIDTGDNTSNIDMGFWNPDKYCQLAPLVALACYENGVATGNSGPGYISFNYDVSGIPTMYGGSAPNPSRLASINSIGSVWASAYRNATSRLYTASFIKRHVGLLDGPGYVYVIDNAGTTPGVVGSFNLQGVAGIDVGSVCRDATCASAPGNTGIASDYTLSTDKTQPNIDLDAYNKVGRASFGDMAMTEDDREIWVVNTYEFGGADGRSLIRIQIDEDYVPSDNGPVPGAVTNYRLATLPGLPGCGGTGVLRPWAVQFNDSYGYMGAVCDASISDEDSDLTAYILRFDPKNASAGFTTTFSFSLDYPREPSFSRSNTEFLDGQWRHWVEVPSQDGGYPGAYAEPILSNLGFTLDGSIVVGLMDRYSHRVGYRNYPPVSGTTTIGGSTFSTGDLIQICNIDGALVLEGTVIDGVIPCGDHDTGQGPSSFARTDDGPGGDGEFYPFDYALDSSSHGHMEIMTGGFAVLPNSGEVITTVYDPGLDKQTGAAQSNTQGVNWYNTSTGNYDRSYRIVNNQGTVTFGKAGGLGEPEMLCAGAPIEIGNRTWLDANENGEQDAGELALSRRHRQAVRSWRRCHRSDRGSAGNCRDRQPGTLPVLQRPGRYLVERLCLQCRWTRVLQRELHAGVRLLDHDQYA